MKGLPKSGKTTWAKAWAAAQHNRLRVSWTEILMMMGKEFRKERQTIAYDAAVRIMKNAIRNGQDVVVDECNLYGSEWGLFVGFAQQAGATVEWHTMKTSVEECCRRNAEAGYPLLEEQIVSLGEKYAAWLK